MTMDDTEKRWSRRELMGTSAAALSAALVAGEVEAGNQPRSKAQANNRRASEIKLQKKRFYDRANRHQRECYQAVMNPEPGRLDLAYLRVEGKRESLIYRASPDQPEVILAKETYILSPHFVGGFLLWVERQGKDWRVRAVDWASPRIDAVFEPFAAQGRPMSLASCRQGEAVRLVWEARTGRHTRIWSNTVQNGKFGRPVPITDGTFNAYDPVCCPGENGSAYVAYCAFEAGNYRIHLQKLNADGRPTDKSRQISDRPGACVYPSICPRKQGGVWFSYTHFEPTTAASTFLTHARHRDQSQMFSENGMIMVGVLADGKLWAPLAPRSPREAQAWLAAGLVYPLKHGGHSQIYETPNGQVWLLCRLHADPCKVHFEDEDEPLARSRAREKGEARNGTRANNHPSICISELRDSKAGWSKPVHLVPVAHLDWPISHAFDDYALRLAFTEDARHTGGHRAAEMFDDIGQLGVGLAQIQLPENGAGRYDLHPYVLRPTPGPSIGEPPLERVRGEFTCVIGQTHMHTSFSNCGRELNREPHLVYRFMQDVTHNDFGGTTDHGYNQWHTEMLVMRKLAEYYYFPGEFVAIPGYEWTGSSTSACTHDGGPFGHMNPLWLEEEGDLEVYSPCDAECAGRSPFRLWEAYRGKKIVTPPHHPVDNTHPWHWKFFDETFIPVVELFQSARGSAEHPWASGVVSWLHRPDWPWVVDVLKEGRRLGFIAGADHGGIAQAGLLVKELTRTGLYEALMARRAFGTTCVACRIEFTCNGAMMGQEVPTSAGDFRLRVHGAETIREIHIVRNGQDVESKPVGDKHVDYRWHAPRQEKGEFWYCRIIFKTGDMAWSSPIWLV